MSRGVYGRELVGASDARPERQKLDGDIAALSAEITRAVNDKGYVAHDPMFTTDVTLVQDNLARANLAAHHGGVTPTGPVIDLFSGPLSSFVLSWRAFRDEGQTTSLATIRFAEIAFQKQLDDLRAAFTVLKRAVGVVPPHLPSVAPHPSSPPPSIPMPPRPVGTMPSPIPVPPPTLPPAGGIPTSVKVALYSALGIGTVIAVMSVLARRGR